MVVLVLSLYADIDKIQMYAQVKSKSADLYHNPYECAEKKLAYFKKGDMIEIEYCNKYRWCKTTKGFVKKDLLRLPEPLRKQDKPMPSSIMKPREVKPVQRVEIIAEPVIIEQSNSSAQVVKVVPQKKKLDAYDEYFKDKSVKVIFKEQ